LSLSPEQLRRLSQLLDEALDRAADQRADWLDSLPEIQAPLLPLLRDMLARQLGESDTMLPPLPEYSERDLDDLAPDETSGLAIDAVVGPYRLLRELGRGGMGSVWLAERTDGTLKRQVALKLPHSALPQRQLAERFARERDILAALSHPHIARLYDAGVTEDGRPYLALEYVEGEAINAYCDRLRLNVRARLELFLQVLAALQYAHGQLVVHRDLKPTNILVTAAGEVKLLDFGIAKLLTDGQAHETELTQVGGRALTPQYASPEQILGQPIATASDVYALGVVLYELLTGSLPYRLKRDSRGALEDAILSADPTRPSQTEVLAGNATVRASTTRKLATTLRGDLDTIILQALKKNAGERYATAQLFAEDLRRYLSGEAVLARPDSAWYRTHKFIRRNWLAAGAAAAVIVALSAGLGVALWQAQVARQETRTAKAVQAFLLDIFQANSSNQADPQKARQTTARELLDIGAKKIETSLGDAPQARMQVLATLGDLYVDLGLNAQSAELHRKRIAIARETYGSDSTEAVEALLDMAFALNTQFDNPEWERSLKEAEAILDRRHDADSLLRARLLSRQADFYQERDLARAADCIDRSIAVYRKYAPSRDFVSALSSAAYVRITRGEWPIARKLLEEAVAVSETPGGIAAADLLPNLYTYLGVVATWQEDLPAADRHLSRGLELARTLNGDAHVETISDLVMYGDFLAATGRASRGVPMLEEARLALRSAKGGDEPNAQVTLLRNFVADLADYGRLEQAIAAEREAQEILARVGKSPRAASMKESRVELFIELGRFAEAGRELDELDGMRESSGVSSERLTRNSQRLRVAMFLAQRRIADASRIIENWDRQDAKLAPATLSRLNDQVLRQELALAKNDAKAALDLAANTLAAIEANPDRSFLGVPEQNSRLQAGKALRQLGRPESAEPNLRRAVTMADSLLDSKLSPRLADAQIALAECLLDLNRYDEAIALAARARNIVAKHRQLGDQYRRPLGVLEVRLAANGRRG
jgi:serine/threonine protein kinase